VLAEREATRREKVMAVLSQSAQSRAKALAEMEATRRAKVIAVLAELPKAMAEPVLANAVQAAPVSGLSPAALQVWEEGFTKVDQGFSVEDELLKQIHLTRTNVSTPYLLLATCYLLLATYMPVTILTTCYWLY
jgi:hypothetical protein